MPLKALGTNSLRAVLPVLVVAALFLPGCGPEDPVDMDYFNDLDKVKGHEKPTPPAINSIAKTAADELIINFTTAGAIDPDTGGNDHLVYFFYVSSANPYSFDDPREWYDERYYLGSVAEAEFSGDPKDVVVFIDPEFDGTLHFWITSYDGGRESDHSNVVSISLP